MGFQLRRSLYLLCWLTVALGCRKTAWPQIEPAKPEFSRASATPAVSPLSISELYPSSALAGVAFQTQPDGTSSIGVAGSGFTRTSVVFLDDQPLATNYHGPRGISGLVTDDLLTTPRTVQISVRDAQPILRRSAPLPFEILSPPRQANPQVVAIYPATVCVGVPFGVLSDGSWSIGISGSGFLPEADAYMDGELLGTRYQGPNSLTAIIPRYKVSKPGTARLTVRIPGGRRSREVPLIIEP